MDDATIVRLGPFSDPLAPTAIDSRCVRLALVWETRRPLCCAGGALVDLRTKIAIERAGIAVAFANESPMLDARAPSGVLARIADASFEGRVTCAALAETHADFGVLGDGCSLRRAAIDRGLPEERFLPEDCMFFPLELVEGVLMPSRRIPREALVKVTSERRSLYGLAQARIASRFGAEIARAIDDAVRTPKQPVLLKTLK